MRLKRTCLSLCALTACQQNAAANRADRDLQRMVDQARCSADEPSAWFADGTCNREPPAGTRTFAAPPASPETTGLAPGGEPVREVPLRVDRALLMEGQRRFELFCAACHGLLGDGHSQVAENMQARKPPSLSEPRIQALPDGQLFRVISEGYGLMPNYRRALSVEQRWGVVAYMRALALSQAVPLTQLADTERNEAARWLR